MSTSRKLLFWFSRFILHTSLLLAISTATTASLFGSPNAIKDVLSKSGAYDQVLDDVLKKAGQDNQEGEENPLKDPKIQELIKQVFTPQRQQSIVENVADGTYRWLDGKVDKPDFKIDLSDAKVIIADGVATHGIERLKTLPVCKRAPSTIDPFSAECRPPNINYDKEKERLKNEMLNHKDFLPEPVITIDSLAKDQSGQTFVDKFGKLPDAFRVMKMLPWIFFLVALLAAGGVVFAAESKRKGISIVGRTMFWDGLFILFITLIFGKLLPRAVSGESNAVLGNILKHSTGKMANYMFIYSGSVLGAGGAAWLTERFTRPKNNNKAKVSQTKSKK